MVPWLFLGDFNKILDGSEKLSHVDIIVGAKDFRDFNFYNMDMKPEGNWRQNEELDHVIYIS